LSSSKVLTRAKLVEAVDKARSAGKVVVFTNGCFDILHVGHIRYLQKARSKGDLLVVGVNTDESVRKLKGTDRPINPEDDRAEVLAALECVDYVTLFAEDTPIELIRAIKPDVDVKGGDYSAEDLPETAVVCALGGRVEIIPFFETDSERFSTTNTLSSITETRKGGITEGGNRE